MKKRILFPVAVEQRILLLNVMAEIWFYHTAKDVVQPTNFIVQNMAQMISFEYTENIVV